LTATARHLHPCLGLLADVTRDFAGSTVYFVIRKADLAKRDFSRVSHL
jgi:hypothetical protein